MPKAYFRSSSSECDYQSIHAHRSQGMPSVSARHQLDEMIPVQSLQNDDLACGQRQTVTRLAALKRPAALRSGKELQLVAGDNGAESEFSRSKQQMRRQSLYGRCSLATVHIAALAGVRMLEKPGSQQQLLSCFRMYREARKHQLACSPTEFFDPVKDRDWLFD